MVTFDPHPTCGRGYRFSEETYIFASNATKQAAGVPAAVLYATGGYFYSMFMQKIQAPPFFSLFLLQLVLKHSFYIAYPLNIIRTMKQVWTASDLLSALSTDFFTRLFPQLV